MSRCTKVFFLFILAISGLQASNAMQLGTSKGTVVFGRPLDLTIPVRFEAPIEDPLNCFSADIFQADAKFDTGRVKIDVTPASNGLDATVRIRSSTTVIEPWAKLILRNNCGSKVTRQYDFLTDFATEMPLSNQQTEPMGSQNLPTVNGLNNSPANQNLRGTKANIAPLQTSTIATGSATATVPSKSVRKVKPKTVESKPSVLAAALPKTLGEVANLGQPRLKMETFQLTDEHQVLLKLSTAMIAPTGMRTPEEIQALAQATAVWRALNGMPSLAPNATTASGRLEVNSPAVADIQTKQKLDFKDLKLVLSNPIVYGLLGLMALALVCVTWLWLHVRRAMHSEYKWLHETALASKHSATEPTEFISTHLHDSSLATVEQVNEHANLNSLNFEEPKQQQQLAEAAFNASPLAVLLSSSGEAALDSNKALASEKAHDKASINTYDASLSAKSPAHFDDYRFDERHLKAQLISKRPVQDMPIISPLEQKVTAQESSNQPRSEPSLLPVNSAVKEANDMLEKIPQKLKQSAEKTILKSKPETNLNVEVKKEPSSEPKNNLIDFEIFSEPVPSAKPSRFAG